jgi:hypothetical protein
MVTKRALRSISMPCLDVIELRRTGFAHVDIAQTIKFAELEALAGDDFAQLDAKIFKRRLSTSR